MKNYQSKIIWLLKLTLAAILIQTLFFKFSAASESVYIFTTLGIEPWGRIGSGIGELIAAVLILIPTYTWLGAMLSVGIISGAIFSHLTVLGIVVQNDGGLLFTLACVVFVISLILLIVNRKVIPIVKDYV